MAACTSVAISIDASAGDDPVPLFQAGEKEMKCVIAIEALGQINVSNAVFSKSDAGADTADITYGGISIANPIIKKSFSGQSGTPYFVSGRTYMGRVS